MPVIIDAPPPPEPSAIEQLGAGLMSFLSQYGILILLIISIAVIFILAILLWKRDQDKEETLFEKDYKKAMKMSKMQANKKRKQKNTAIIMIISGLIAGFIGIVELVLFGFMGFFMTWLTIPSILLAGWVIDYFAHPLMKSDRVILRYKQGDKIVERFLGNYQGEFFANDGFWYVTVSKGRRKIFWRNDFILKVPQNSKVFEEYNKRHGNDKDKKIPENFLKEVLQFNEDSIIINHAKSVEMEEMFYYPVFQSSDGNIIDNGLLYYESDKRNALITALYQQTQDFSVAQSDAIKINASARYKQFVGDDYIADESRKHVNPQDKERY